MQIITSLILSCIYLWADCRGRIIISSRHLETQKLLVLPQCRGAANIVDEEMMFRFGLRSIDKLLLNDNSGRPGGQAAVVVVAGGIPKWQRQQRHVRDEDVVDDLQLA